MRKNMSCVFFLLAINCVYEKSIYICISYELGSPYFLKKDFLKLICWDFEAFVRPMDVWKDGV